MLNILRQTGLALTFALLAWPVFAGSLPPVSDLEKDGRLAERGGMPIMVFFMSRTCPYCEEVRTLYLEPLYREGGYRDKLIIRVVNIDSRDSMRDFNGKRTDHAGFAGSQGASFTPVIKFYDARGRELVPEILGYMPDFYLGFLEGSIRDSINKLHAQKKVATSTTKPAS